jgi:AraC-like DNA-binding protein/mannose-6-phosphate isomerase-like protein (cupin superfamily)
MNFEAEWCRIAYSSYENWNYNKHSHSFYELHYCLAGECAFRIRENTNVQITRGEFLLIPKNEVHQLTEVSDDFTKLVMGFHMEIHSENPDQEIIEAAYRSVNAERTYMATDEMKQIVIRILNEIQRNHLALVEVMCNHIELLMIEIGRVLKPDYEPCKLLRISENDERFLQVQQFIRENISTCLNSEEVANYICLSTKQLSRIIRNHTGFSLARYIQKEKIDYSKKLLIDTKYTIKEIAGILGYSDEFNFSRGFKSVEGMSPLQYRKSVFTQSMVSQNDIFLSH